MCACPVAVVVGFTRRAYVPVRTVVVEYDDVPTSPTNSTGDPVSKPIIATPAAWAHLGLTPPGGTTGGNGQQDLFGA